MLQRFSRGYLRLALRGRVFGYFTILLLVTFRGRSVGGKCPAVALSGSAFSVAVGGFRRAGRRGRSARFLPFVYFLIGGIAVEDFSWRVAFDRAPRSDVRGSRGVGLPFLGTLTTPRLRAVICVSLITLFARLSSVSLRGARLTLLNAPSASPGAFSGISLFCFW